MRLPVDGDDGAVFHLMRRVLQQHGARWVAALPEMTKAQWAVLRATADDRCDQNTVAERTPYTAREVAALAHVHHGIGDQAASISSGSFSTDGMIIEPCSMKPFPASARATPTASSGGPPTSCSRSCLLYTSDAADEL